MWIMIYELIQAIENLQASGTHNRPECRLSGDDALVETGNHGEGRLRLCDGLPVRDTHLPHGLRLWRLHPRHHRVGIFNNASSNAVDRISCAYGERCLFELRQLLSPGTKVFLCM